MAIPSESITEANPKQALTGIETVRAPRIGDIMVAIVRERVIETAKDLIRKRHLNAAAGAQTCEGVREESA